MEMSTTIPKLCLAPMVRVGTLPFRLLALRLGADIVYTEEIIDKKLILTDRVHNEELGTIDFVNKQDKSVVLRICDEEKDRLVCQIGSNNPDTVVEAAKVVENDVKSIDINMGCPEHFSVHAGMGAGLLKTPDVAKSIMSALTNSINIPISCKVRILPKLKDTLDFIKCMQGTGIHHISVHARIREEMSRGFAHWSVVHEAVKDPEITIPINISGDCFSPNDALEIKKYTQCNGILIARGACHNPQIFKDIKDYWQNIDQIEEIKEDIYAEHKKHIDDLNLESLIMEEVKEIPVEATEDMSRNQAKKRAKKLLKKIKKGKPQENGVDGKVSKNLVKIIEARNKGSVPTDILNLCKQYLKICIEYGNKLGNTKYVLNYVLRTHKDHFETFLKINDCRNMEDLAKTFSLEDYFKEQLALKPSLEQHYDDTYYKKVHKKNKLKKISETETKAT